MPDNPPGALVSNSPRSPVRVVASGGGAENRLLTQTIADMLGVPVFRIANAANSGIMGNLVIAGNALGWFQDYALPPACMHHDAQFTPIPENPAFYRQAFPVFKRLYHALSGEFHAIAELQAATKQRLADNHTKSQSQDITKKDKE